jgi:hypothetical protein
MQYPSEWQQRKYDEVFDSIRMHVRRRRAEDPQFTIDTLMRLLETEYLSEGDDWIGRGSVQNITHAATVAAYEAALAEWQQERQEGGG